MLNKPGQKVPVTANPSIAAPLCLSFLIVALLSGCTHTLIVEGKFPAPLVNEIPLVAGLHLPMEFKNYRYIEASADRAKWIIDMGEAQSSMFQTVLPGMFAQVQELNTLAMDTTNGGNTAVVDFVISPRIEEFQYTLPSETKIKVYEIWLKYNVQVFDNRGELIADWILTAYGKTPTGFMQSDETALNQAVVVALRDAGANLALNFTNVPEMKAWLAQRL